MMRRSQTDVVLHHLKKYGSINALEAIAKYGITRISARIYSLRKRGIAIKSVESETADGFVDYVLDLDEQRLQDGQRLRDSVTAKLALVSIRSDEDLQYMSRTLTDAAVEANRVVNMR